MSRKAASAPTPKFAAKKASLDAWERTGNSKGQKKEEKEAT